MATLSQRRVLPSTLDSIILSLSALDLCIWATDSAHRLTLCLNPGNGYNSPEVLGLSARELFDSSTCQAMEMMVSTVFSTNLPIECQAILMLKMGKTRIKYRIAPIRDSIGNVVGCVAAQWTINAVLPISTQIGVLSIQADGVGELMPVKETSRGSNAFPSDYEGSPPDIPLSRAEQLEEFRHSLHRSIESAASLGTATSSNDVDEYPPSRYRTLVQLRIPTLHIGRSLPHEQQFSIPAVAPLLSAPHTLHSSEHESTEGMLSVQRIRNTVTSSRPTPPGLEVVKESSGDEKQEIEPKRLLVDEVANRLNEVDDSLVEEKKKRRRVEDSHPNELWHCHLGCGKAYRKTSCRSIKNHYSRCPVAQSMQQQIPGPQLSSVPPVDITRSLRGLYP